ncbi:MAG TPA: hypothetical protein ENN27_02115 [Candidatus Atribacteria bacterium]|nr:hypothetical protein [Candidatus Atribacteria bacterium]
MLDKIAILSPNLMGLKQDYPAVLLRDAWLPDCKDIFFQNGTIQKYKKRLLEFDYQFPDKILNIEYYFKESANQWWSVYFTRRDIAYRDIPNKRFVFINKKYDTGTITVTNNSKIVTGSGTSWNTNAKAGDFIALKDADNTMHSNLVWYEIDTVDSDTQITLKVAYEGATETGKTYFIRKTFTGTDFDYWSITTFYEKLLATNNGIDKIIVWTGTGEVADLTCPYKARSIFTYGNRVILGFLTDIETGDVYPMGWAWSKLGDETVWGGTGEDAGMDIAIEGTGVITTFTELRGSLYIFKERSIIQAWNVETKAVFNKKLIEDGVGTMAPNSVVVEDPYIYYYCPDNTFRQFNGIKSITISDEISEIIKNLHPDYEKYIQVLEIEIYNQILWAVPYGDSERNNKLLIYDLDFAHNNWGVADMEVSCIGYYTIEEILDWNSLPFNNWIDWDWPCWNYIMGLEAFPIDLAGGYDGKIYRLNADVRDVGEDYESYFTLTTDLKNLKLLPFFKRLLNIRVFAEKEATGTLKFRIKRDTEATWQEAGEVDLSGDSDIVIRDLPVDFLARNFLIEPYSINNFNFLGCVLDYSVIGDR